jgi:serine/threonine protein kinase
MRNQLLGSRYRILDRIGEGGMAFVYLALDEKLGRKVAIKVLHEHMEKNADIRKRFQLEAEAVSRLEHPNIVKIYDFSGGESDRLWIVTEVIRGRNLAQYADKGEAHALHPVIATCIVREILRALTKAHDIGIVHRDIKPENVMITVDGRVKLMDFGIAKDLGRSNVTQTGTFMGSPSYMSPEQIRGRDVDQRSDLYSLSVLFYEIITGRLPFVGQTTHEVVMRIVDGAFTEPRFIVPTLPDTLNDLIVKGMAKKPDDRHESARAYGTILDQFLSQLGFDESHIELERYAQDKSSFEERLVKTQIVPPSEGSPSLRLRTSRLYLPESGEKSGKSRVQPPAPPYVTDRRTVPRSYGAKRFKSSYPMKIATQSKQSITYHTPRPQSPTQGPRGSAALGKNHESAPNNPTPISDKKRASSTVSKDPSHRPNPPFPERPKPPLPRPSAMSALRRAQAPIPETGIRPVIPPPPQRRLPVQRVIRRRSAAPAPKPVRIAIVRPSFVTRAMGFLVIGLLLGISVWGFFQLDSRMSRLNPVISDTKKSTFDNKDVNPVTITKTQPKTLPKRTRNPFIPVKSPSSVQSKKDKNLATTEFRAMKPDRSQPAREDKNDSKVNKPTPRGNPTPKQGFQAPETSPASGKNTPKPAPVLGRPPTKESLGPDPKLASTKTSNRPSDSPQAAVGRPSAPMAPMPPGRDTKAPVSNTPEKPEKVVTVSNEEGAKDKSSGPTTDKTGSGRFKISSQPASEIFLDGRRLGTTVDGTTSSNWLSASAGRHTVELKRQGYAPHKTTVEIKAGEDQTLPRVDLDVSGPNTKSNEGKVGLTITVSALPAQVTVRETESNTIQVFQMKVLTRTLQLSSGRYFIKIEHKGQVKERELMLSPIQGNMTFSADFKENE